MASFHVPRVVDRPDTERDVIVTVFRVTAPRRRARSVDHTSILNVLVASTTDRQRVVELRRGCTLNRPTCPSRRAGNRMVGALEIAPADQHSRVDRPTVEIYKIEGR